MKLRLLLFLLSVCFSVEAQRTGFFFSTVQSSAPDSEYPAVFEDDAIWINGRNADGKTLTGPFSTIISSLSTNDDNALSFTAVAGETNQAKFSSKWIYAGGDQGLECTNKAAYKFIHDNTTDYEIFFRLQIIRATATSLIPLAQTNNSTGAQIGFSINYDNRSASSRTNALVFNISNGTTTIASRVVNNVIIPASWNDVRIKYVSATKVITIWVDEVQVDTFTITGSHSSSNSTGNLTLFRFSGTATPAKDLLLKQLVIVKRVLTAPEVTSLYDYFTEGDETFSGSTRTVNLYYLGGQSNMYGSPNSPSAYLQGALGSAVWEKSDNAGAFESLDWPTNHNIDNGANNQFGPILEFGYRMGLLTNVNTVLFHYSVSSTTMHTDWNVDTGGTTQTNMFNIIDSDTDFFIDKMKYQLDATVIVRGFLWRQGESDATTSNPLDPNGPAIQAAYKSQFTALYKKFLDTFEDRGYDITKCRLVVSKLHWTVPYPVDRPHTAEINAALQDVALNFRTDNPSYASKCLDGTYFETNLFGLEGDGVHFNATGQVSQGFAFYTALSPYVNE